MPNIIGKTVAKIDKSFGDNVLRIVFTDGTSVVIDTEPIGHGLYAPVLMSEAEYVSAE
jgi:hypothetical protein